MSSSQVHDIRQVGASAQATEPQERDASFALSEHLARTRFEHLPAQDVEAAKASILDTLGCVYAGTACDDVIAAAPPAR